MIFYLTIIVITFVVFSCSCKIKNQSLRLMSCIISILPASIIAGLRDLNVGQDLMGYGIVFFERAQSADSLLYLVDVESKEYGYHALNFVCSKIINEIHFFLFVTEFFKLLFVVLSILFFKKYCKYSCWLLLIYMLFMYCEGLSLIRQSIALAICFYSLTFYLKGKYKQYVCVVLFAYIFHNSALIFFLLPLLNFLYKKSKRLMIVIVILVFLLYTMSTKLFLFIANSGLFKDGVAERYLDSGVNTAKTNILITFWIILSTYLLQNKSNIKKQYIYLIKSNALFALLFLFMAEYFEVAFRVSYYQFYVLMFLYVYFVDNIRITNIKRMCLTFFVFLFLLHFIVTAKNGMCGTIPYSSIILDSLLI